MAGILSEDPKNTDYEQSAQAQADQVFQLVQQSGLNGNDVWVLRLFLAELRKALKTGGSVWLAIDHAIAELRRQKQAYQDTHKNGADPWPPHSKMPVRFGDPREELKGLLLGKTSNASRYIEPERRQYLDSNNPIE